MNTKTFKVTAEIKIRRPVWRWLGFGDQPSKREVEDFFWKIVVDDGLAAPESVPEINVRYLGSPGYYVAEVIFGADQPWWRKMGFGDTASRAEVKWHFVDKINTVAHSQSILVEIVH